MPFYLHDFGDIGWCDIGDIDVCENDCCHNGKFVIRDITDIEKTPMEEIERKMIRLAEFEELGLNPNEVQFAYDQYVEYMTCNKKRMEKMNNENNM